MKKLLFYLFGTFWFRLATFWELRNHMWLVPTLGPLRPSGEVLSGRAVLVGFSSLLGVSCRQPVSGDSWNGSLLLLLLFVSSAWCLLPTFGAAFFERHIFLRTPFSGV